MRVKNAYDHVLILIKAYNCQIQVNTTRMNMEYYISRGYIVKLLKEYQWSL